MIGLLMIATASVAQPMTFKEVQDQTRVCGLIFNVDGTGPAGDGVYLDPNMRGLTLSSTRPKEGMACMQIGRSGADCAYGGRLSDGEFDRGLGKSSRSVHHQNATFAIGVADAGYPEPDWRLQAGKLPVANRPIADIWKTT